MSMHWVDSGTTGGFMIFFQGIQSIDLNEIEFTE